MKNIGNLFKQKRKFYLMGILPVMLFVLFGHVGYSCHLGAGIANFGPTGVVPDADNCGATVDICFVYETPFAGNSYPCTKDITATSPAGGGVSGAVVTNFTGDSVEQCFDVALCPGNNPITYAGNGTTLTPGGFTDNTGGAVDSGLPDLVPTFTVSEMVVCAGDVVMLTPDETRSCVAFSGTGVAGNMFTAPAGNGCYTITNTVGAGDCAVTSTMDITVYEAAAPAAAADVEICASDAPAMLMATCPDCAPGGTCATATAGTTWYDAGGAMVGTGAMFSVPETSPGMYTYSATCSCGPCESPATDYNAVIAAEPTITVEKIKCDGNPMNFVTAADISNTADDIYTYNVIVTLSDDPGTVPLTILMPDGQTVTINTVPGQLVYIFSSDPANPNADDTSLLPIPVTLAGPIMATVMATANLSCDSTFELAAEDDCSCTRRYCGDESGVSDTSVGTTPDGPLTPPSDTNPAFETIYVLTDPNGIIVQTDDMNPASLEFDLTTLPPTSQGGVICEVWAVNYNSMDPAAAAYVGGAVNITQLCYPTDPCLCIDVSCSACYIEKLPEPEPGTCSAPIFICQGNPDATDLTLTATCPACADPLMGDTSVEWYIDPNGPVVATGPTFDPTAFDPDFNASASDPAGAPVQYNYFFACLCEGCVSPQAACAITINPQPEPPSCPLQKIEYCEGEVVPPIDFLTSSLSGSSDFNFYADAAGGTLLLSATAMPTATLDLGAVTALVGTTGNTYPGPDTYTFYFSETIEGAGGVFCESALGSCSFTIIPASDPSWEAGFMCCTDDPILLYMGPNAAACATATLESIDGMTPVYAETGYFTGDGVYHIDNGTPLDPTDDCYYFDPTIGVAGTTTGPLGGTGTPVLAEGEISVLFLVGQQPCQETQLNDFYVYCTVDACISGEAICVCGCGEYDLTQTFCGDPTTLGGIFCIDPNAPDGVPVAGGDGTTPTADGGAEGSITVVGDILDYDPDLITEVTTIDVKYSVGNADAGGDCIDVGQTTITLVPKPNVDFDLPDGPLCTNNLPFDVSEYLTGENLANGEIEFDMVGTPGTVVATGTDFTIDPSMLTAGDYYVTYTELVSDGAGQDCLATQTEYFSILPGGVPDWTNPSPVCLGEVPITLTVTGDAGGTWSSPTDPDTGDPIVDAMGVFTPPVSGVYTITYCVGEGVCEECLTQAIEVFACVDAETVVDDIVCASSSNCYDLEQQFEPTTTPGGVWGNLLDVGGVGGAITLNGTNICYDPATLTEATTVSVDYSVVAYPGADGNCCIGLSTTTITIVPQPEVDLDLPSSFCNLETINLYDYVVAPSAGAGAGDGAGVFTVADTIGADLSGTIVIDDLTGSIDFGTYTGLIEICYSETITGTSAGSPDTEPTTLPCTDQDCEIITIDNINGEIVPCDIICLSSSNCYDLEQLFYNEDPGPTTQGGIWFPTGGVMLPAGTSIDGTNLCYDPDSISAPVTIDVSYSVAGTDLGTGQTCVQIDEASITLVPQPEVDLDLPSSFCTVETDINLFDYVVDPSSFGPGTWTSDTTAFVINADGTVVINGNFTGDVKICYTEEVTSTECGGLTCDATDCEIIAIGDISADIKPCDIVCLSSSECYDLEQLFNNTTDNINDTDPLTGGPTTSGGIWYETNGGDPDDDISIDGTNLCYNADSISAPVTINVSYSVGTPDLGGGTTCVRIEDANITLVPQPEVDLDLPSAFCTLETINLYDFVVAPSVGADGNAPPDPSNNGYTSTFTVTDAATGMDAVVGMDTVTIDNTVGMTAGDLNFVGYTGSLEICYTETYTGECIAADDDTDIMSLTCTDTDCEIIDIFDISADVVDEKQVTCLSSSNCYDLEQLFINDDPSTTQGGIWYPTDGTLPAGTSIDGTNVCYDPDQITDPVTVNVTYSVYGGVSGTGTTCVLIDDATIVLVPNPDVDLDLPSDFCTDEAINLNDYLFSNGIGVDMDDSGVWTIYEGNDTTEVHTGSDLDPATGIITTFGDTGLHTICYTETETYECPETGEITECIAEDCEVVNIFDISAELTDKLVACVSSSNCFDMEQFFTDETTEGGIFYPDMPPLPDGFVVNGTNLCYDPELIEDPTSINIAYSVAGGVSGSGETCIRVDVAEVVLIPLADIDLDLPSGFCVDETVDLNDYLFSDSIGVDMDDAGVWTIDPDIGNLDPAAGTVSDFGGIGLYTVCYTETETYECPDTGEISECVAEDCEVIEIYDISAELSDKLVACLSSSNCFDLEQFFVDGTTPGGIFLPETPPLADGFTINGTNICYDPALISDPTTVGIVYSVSDGPSGTGTTCIRTDAATVVLIPQANIDLDLPSGFCVDETVNFNDYLFSDSIGVDTDNAGVWTIDPNAGDLDSAAGTISDFGGIGLYTVCYTETETYVCPDTGETTECVAEDCEVIEIYDISAELTDEPIVACLSSSSCFDMEQFFVDETTQGGIFYPETPPLPDGFEIQGTNLCYDADLIEDPTTVNIVYSVADGPTGTGTTCIRTDVATVTIVPQPGLDLDLPSGFCIDETVNFNDYLFSDSIGVDMDNAGVWTITPDLGNLDSAAGTISDFGGTGLFTVCYSETETDPDPDSDFACDTEDCEVIEIYDISAELTDEPIVACLSSSNCFDMEQFFVDETTQGGIFYPETPPLPDGFEVQGTNLCYDPDLIEDPTTVNIVYSVADGPTGTGTTCIRTDVATVTIVPQPGLDLDLPSGFCIDETVNFNDYLFSDSIGVDIDNAGVWTITPDSGNLDSAAGTISDFGGTGLFTVCYTETETDPDPDSEYNCATEDCEVIEVYDISAELTDSLSACLSSSACFDMENFFTQNTTQGGIFFPTDPSMLPPGFVINGNSICYDPAEVVDVTTIDITYSVADGPTGTGTTCIRVDEATLTLVPQLAVDLDLPSFVCALEDLVLNDYVLDPSNDDGPIIIDNSGFSIAEITAQNNSMCDPATSTCAEVVIDANGNAVLDIADGFIGLIEVCYGEEIDNNPDDEDPSLNCNAYDCEIIYVNDIYADLNTDAVCTCLSSTNCYDLEQLYVQDGSIPLNNNTTPGGVWLLTAGGGSIAINGNNLCYDPMEITTTTTVEVTYSVAAGPAGIGTECIKFDEVEITLIPTPDPYFAGEQDVCASDAPYTLEVYDDLYDDNSWYADNGNWTVVGSGAGNTGVDGIGAGIFAPNGNSLDVDPIPAVGDPSLSGQYTITFTVTSAGPDDCEDCSDTIITTITIGSSFDACFDLPQQICESVGPFVLAADEDVLTDFTDNGFFGQDESEISIWTYVDSNGVVQTLPLVGDGSGDAIFDPSTIGPGLYTITHYLGYDDCQTTCVATIEIKPNVNAEITDMTICSSTSQNMGLSIMFTGNTTGGGTFTFSGSSDPACAGAADAVGTAVDPNGNIVCITSADVTILPNGTLVYNSELMLNATSVAIPITYTVGDPLCCDDPTTDAVEECGDPDDAAGNDEDCYDQSMAILYIGGGHDVFLDFPEEDYCSDEEPICIYEYCSIEDQSLPLVTVDLDGTLEPGEIRFEVVAVNGSYHPDSLAIDGNNDGDYDDPIDFHYTDIIDYSGCVGTDGAGASTATFTCDCATINLERVSKDITFTIRKTYYDGLNENPNGNGTESPFPGCIAVAEDNIQVIPAGNAAIMDGEICAEPGTIDLTDFYYIEDSEYGSTTLCGTFYIQCPEDAGIGTTGDPNDTNGDGGFGPTDASYPVYDFSWLTDPSKLYVTHVVGQEPCVVDTFTQVIDVCPAIPGFGDLTLEGCYEGGILNLNDYVGLDITSEGEWTFNGSPIDVTNVNPCTDFAQGDVLTFTPGASGGCCPAGASTLTIGVLDCPLDDCVIFGDGSNGDPLQPEYCASADNNYLAGTTFDLGTICPDIISVPTIATSYCNVEQPFMNGSEAVNTYTLTTQVAGIGDIYPNATVNDDWFIQLAYLNDETGCSGAGNGFTVPESALGGGDHWGFTLYGTSATGQAGLPAPNPMGNQPMPATLNSAGQLYNIEDNACPRDIFGPPATTNTQSCGGAYVLNPDYYALGNGSNLVDGWVPSAGTILPTNPAPFCDGGAGIGANDYFVLQFTAADIYAMYGGKDIFLQEFFGNNCNVESAFHWTFNSNTLDQVTDIQMVLGGMEIYNYKEDVSMYTDLFEECPATSAEDAGFTVTLTDILCDGDDTPPSGLPSWVDESAVFDVTAGAANCFDVTLNLEELTPPDCDANTYEFEICHEVVTCDGDCEQDTDLDLDGDGVVDTENLANFVSCYKIAMSRDQEIVTEWSYTEDGEEGIYNAGCIDNGKLYFDYDLLDCFYEPTSENCGVIDGGEWCIPAPFCDYVIQNGNEFAILPSICDSLTGLPSLGLGADFGYSIPADADGDEPYPFELNNEKNLIIPVEYKWQLCSSCPEGKLVRYMRISKTPEVELALEDSPGICPQAETVICLDESCNWPGCTYELILTNANDVALVIADHNGDGIPDLQDGCNAHPGTPPGPAVVPGVTIEPGFCDGADAIVIDWQTLTMPGGFLDNLGEQLFGQFEITLNVYCGNQTSYCTGTSTAEDVFFLGEVNADIEDVDYCESDVNLTSMFVNEGPTQLGTTGGGAFYIFDGDIATLIANDTDGDGVIESNETDATAGFTTGVTPINGNSYAFTDDSYVILYVVGATTDCQEYGYAILTISNSFAVFFDIPEQCTDDEIDLGAHLSVIETGTNTAVADIDGDELNGTNGNNDSDNYNGWFMISGYDDGSGNSLPAGEAGIIEGTTGIYAPGPATNGYVTIRYTLQTLDAAGDVLCEIVEEEIIVVHPPITLVLSDCMCDVGARTITISGIGGGNGGDYQVYYSGGTIPEGSNGFIDNVAAGTDFTLTLHDDEVTYTVEVFDNRGCGLSQSGACPGLEEDPQLVGVQNPICASDADYTISIDQGAGGNTDGFWLNDGPDGLFTDNGDGTLTVSPTAILGDATLAGTYTITYGVAGGETTDCEILNIFEEITIYPSYDACFEIPQSAICVSDGSIPLNADDSLIDLFGQTADELSVWTVVGPNGTATLTSDASGDATFTPDGPGLYTINHSIGHDICQTECSAVIEVKPAVDATINDITLCTSESQSVDLGIMFGSNTTGGGTFSVNGVDLPGGIYQYVNNPDGVASVTVTYTVGDLACCIDQANCGCFASSTATLSFETGPELFFDIEDFSFCSDTDDGPVTIHIGDFTSMPGFDLGDLIYGVNAFVQVVAVDGSTSVLGLDLNGDGDFNDANEFDYSSIVSGTVGAPFAIGANPELNLSHIPKEVIITVRVTYTTGDVDGNGDGSVTGGTGVGDIDYNGNGIFDVGCTAVAQDNFMVQPYGFPGLTGDPICVSGDGSDVLDLQGLLDPSSTPCGTYTINCDLPQVGGAVLSEGDTYIIPAGATQLWITYTVGAEECGVNSASTVVDLIQGESFPTTNVDICTGDGPVNLNGINYANILGVGGTWYGPFSGPTLDPTAGTAITNPYNLDVSGYSNGLYYFYYMSDCGARSLLVIDVVGQTDPDLLACLPTAPLDASYCSVDGTDLSVVDFYTIQPTSIVTEADVSLIGSVKCEVPDNGIGTNISGPPAEVSISFPAGVFEPNVQLKPGWFIEVSYLAGEDAGTCTESSGQIGIDPADYQEGDHDGYVLLGPGAYQGSGVPGMGFPSPSNFAITSAENGQCAPDGTYVISTESSGGIGSTGIGEPVPDVYCDFASDNHFTLRLTDQDIYDAYGGYENFISNLAGDACGSGGDVTVFTFLLRAEENQYDIAIRLYNFTAVNYKEDVSAYSPWNGGGVSSSLSIDDNCNDQADDSIPAWVDVNSALAVNEIPSDLDPSCPAYQIDLNLNALVPPVCDGTTEDAGCMIFEICHTVGTCDTGCNGPELAYCQKVSIGRQAVLDDAGSDEIYALGCKENGKIEFTSQELTNFFGVSGSLCGVGEWSLAEPYRQYLLSNGSGTFVLDTAIASLPEFADQKVIILDAQYVISAETSGCIACGDIVINKQLSIICTPEVVLDVPASPGICPSDKSYIDIDGDCVWPNCVVNLTFTNAETVTLIDGNENSLPYAGSSPATPVDGVTYAPNPANGNPAICIDWQNVTAITEPLFGDFTLEMTVYCGTSTNYCSATGSQNLFFLGDVNAALEDWQTCDQPINLTNMFISGAGGTSNATTPGGLFFIDGGDGVYNEGVGDDLAIGGNETTLAAGTYTVHYVIGATTNCEEVGTAELTVLSNYAVFMDAPEICGGLTVDLTETTNIVDVLTGGSFNVTNPPSNTSGEFSIEPASAGSISNNVFTATPGFTGYVTVRYTLTVQLGEATCTIIEEEVIAVYPEFDACFDIPGDGSASASTEFCVDDASIVLAADDNLATVLGDNSFGLSESETSSWSWVSSNGSNGFLPLVGDGSGDATFDPSAVPAGTYVITHTIGFGNCTTVCTAILTVYDAVDATINDIVMPCGTSPAGAIPLTAMFGSGTTLHGSFAGSGSGLIFGDALLYNQPGCYQVAYTASSYDGGDGACESTDGGYVLVPEYPDPTFFIQDQVCWSVGDPNQTYTPITFSPSYTGSVSTNWTVTGPATVDAATGALTVTGGSGTIILTMTETITTLGCGSLADVDCSASYEASIVVEGGTAQDASFAADLMPCIGDVVDLAATTPGGIFTGQNVTDNGDGLTGSFTATASGDYAVTYLLNTSNGCSNAFTQVISVDEIDPVLTCPESIVVNADASGCGAQVTIPDPMPTDNCGIESYSNDYNNTGDASDFYPTGVTLVTYTVTDSAGNTSTCSFTVTVIDDVPPVVTCPVENVINICAPVTEIEPKPKEFFSPSDNCSSYEDIDMAVSDLLIPQGPINVIIQTYTFTDASGNTSTCQIIYNTSEFLQSPTVSDPDPICQGDLLSGIKIGGGDYNFYNDNSGSQGDLVSTCDYEGIICSTADFGIDTDIPGIYTIWVTEFVTNIDGSICESTPSAINFEILPAPEATLTANGTTVCNDQPINLMDYVSENQSGYWSGPGVFSTSTAFGDNLWIFSGNGLAPISPVTLYYTVSNGGCETSYIFVVSINEGQLAYWSNPGPFCSGTPALDLNDFVIGDLGGTWSGDAVSAEGIFDPAGASGSFEVTYTTIDGTNDCGGPQTHVITVYDGVDPGWELVSPVCDTDTPIDLMSLVTGTAGGSFSGEGVTNNMFFPGETDGSADITYSVGAADCAEEYTLSIEVIDQPWPPVGSDAVYCSNEESMALSVEYVYPFSYEWYSSESGGTSINSGTEYDLSGATPGNYTYYVEAVSPEGCVSERTPINIEIGSPPTVSYLEVGCIDDSEGYTVSFTVNGSQDTYYVDGVAVASGTTFESDILFTPGYFFTVTDGGICGAKQEIVSGKGGECGPGCYGIYTSDISANAECAGAAVEFTVTLTDALANDQIIIIEGPEIVTTTMVAIGNGQYTGSITLANPGCGPDMRTYTVTAFCSDGEEQVGQFTEDITVYPSSIENFINIDDTDPCMPTANVDDGCESYITIEEEMSFTPEGEPEVMTFNYMYFSITAETLGCFDVEGSMTVDIPEECRECDENEAGLMQTSQTYVCDGDEVIMGVAFNVTGANSVVGYILHEGEEFDPATTTIIETSTTGAFGSPGAAYNNTPLYITAVTGYPDANGFPDLDHERCPAVWTPYGAYVIFLDAVNVTILEEGCEGDEYYITLMVNGGVGVLHPNAAYLTVTDGTTMYTDISAEEEITFGPYSGSGEFLIEVLDAKGCTGFATGSYSCGANAAKQGPSPALHYGVNIYPNPTDGLFEVNCVDCIAQPTKATIYRSNGAIVQSRTNGLNLDLYEERFDISGEASGVYLIKLQYSDSSFKYYKVVKE